MARKTELVDTRGGPTVLKRTVRTKNGKALGRPTTNRNFDWYNRSDDELFDAVIQHVNRIRERQTRRQYEQVVYQALYNNSLGTLGVQHLFSPGSMRGAASRLTVNVVKSCVDTATARIGKDLPRVWVIPNSADESLIKRADDCTKFLDGAFVASGTYESNQEAFRDAGIHGDGYVWFREDDGQIVSDVVKVDELVINEIDGIRNKPREMHIVRVRPRAELIAEFPDQESLIRDASPNWRNDANWGTESDVITVIYSWHLKSGTKAKDGRRSIVIDKATLLSEPYDKGYIPVVRWQWTPPTYGPFGRGIVHEIEGMQAAITQIMRAILRSIFLFAVPRVWIDKISQVSVHQIDNEISVNTYQGKPPVFDTPQAMSPDIYQFLERLIELCYQQLGLSQLSAQSEKPAGLNSGVGLRNYQDIETQRFSVIGQRWERLHVEEAKIILDMAADLYSRGNSIAVDVPGRGFVETVQWKDISLRTDQYQMQAFPTSLLPRTPEGQLQTVQEYMNSGILPQDVALSLLRIPNLDAYIRQRTASLDNINACISRIRDKKKYKSPNGIANIDTCVTMAMAAWLQADMDSKTDPVVVDLLERFLDEAVAIQKAKNAPPPAPGPQGPGGPAVGQAPTPQPAPFAAAGTGPVAVPQAA